MLFLQTVTAEQGKRFNTVVGKLEESAAPPGISVCNYRIKAVYIHSSGGRSKDFVSKDLEFRRRYVTFAES